MGGLGSGNRGWRDCKSTVDGSLTFSGREFRGRLHDGTAGILTWTGRDGDKASINYVVTWHGAVTFVTLAYTFAKTENVYLPIRLQSTPTQFGGRRWWFTCPLIVGGVPCRRRVGKLHVPPGGRYFGCRHCHDLTYRSSQQAHQDDRLVRNIAADLGIHPKIARMLLKDSRKHF